jgi:serine/threonine protein kinase
MSEAIPPVPPAIPAGLAEHHRYRILGLIETGGMGAVFLAEHLFLKRLVALKVIKPSLVQNRRMRERFFREMQAVAHLCHANIVSVYDADVAGDTHFMVMELVDGMALHKVVRQNGPLGIQEACKYVLQTAAGMQHALDCNILHRDIKPNNLMLTPQGTVKILDFGLAGYLTELAAGDVSFDIGASSADSGLEDGQECASSTSPAPFKTTPLSLRLTSQAMGTPDFIAPEMVLFPLHADVRADIYSLGCTLYFLLTGRVPFPTGGRLDKVRAHCNEAPAPLRQLRPEIPERLAAVIDRMMDKEPEKRPATPAEVIEALKPFASSARGMVLVVDDDVLIQAALTLALEIQGFTVQVASDGLEALSLLRSGPPPQLILLDIMMPRMDGLQFLQERQRDAALAAIPVVVLSGLDPNIAGKTTGTVDYLLKPIDAEEIAKQIQRYFARGDS